MFIVLGGSSAKGQRRFANIESHSNPQVLLFVTLSEVTNWGFAVDSTNLGNFSTLSANLGLLSLIEASQNLRFTNSDKPLPGSPIIIKFSSTTQLISLSSGFILQPTLNGADAGTPYASSTIVNLLSLLGNPTAAELMLPAPNVTYDGIKLKVNSTLLGTALTANYYYAFFIVAPRVNNTAICSGSTTTLTVNNAQPGYTYRWYNSSGTLIAGATGSTFTTPALSTTTSYSVEAVEPVTFYYSAKTPITVTVNNPPTTANAGTNQSLCSTTITTLTGNTPTTGAGVWSKISGPGSQTFGSSSNPTTTVNGLTTGTYVFRWTISNAPCAASTSDVTVVVGAPVTASNAGTAQNLCAATSTTMAANAPIVGMGAWSQDSGPSTAVFTSPNLNNTTVTGLVTGDYVFKWTISSGSCTTSASTVNVKVTASTATANAGIDQNLCNVTSTTLAGNSPSVGTGAWSWVSGPNTPTITSASANNAGLSGMIPGTYVYRWTITNAPCAASFDDVSIIISAPPTTASAGPNQLLCSVTGTTLAGNSASVGTGAWSWISGPNTPVITTPATNNSTVTGMIAGTYVFRWTISSGACAASTSDVTIIVGVTPTITLGTAPSACQEITSATLVYTGTTGSPVTYSITWSGPALTAGFTNVSNAALPVSPITLTVPGAAPMAAYTGSIVVKNAAGCESTSVPFTFTIHPKPATPSFSITTSN